MATACYVDKSLDASFKGFPFQATMAASEHGRRGAEGEFPFGENTAYADLGRRIRKYSIEARFVSNDHIEESGAFLAICESRGPGVLVHPTRGVIQAACISAKAKDDLLEGQGITTVELEFIEANDWVNGFSFGIGLITGIDISDILSNVSDLLNSNYIVSSVPFFLVNEVLGYTRSSYDSIYTEFVRATSSLQDDDVWKAYSDFEYRINSTNYLSDPKLVYDTITLGHSAVYNYSVSPNKFDSFRTISNKNTKNPSITRTGALAQNAIVAATRIVSASYMAKAALEENSINLTVALNRYEQVTSILMQEIEVAQHECNNSLFLSLRNLLVTVQKILLNKAYNLPALISYDMGGSVHSVTAAYAILNDTRRVDDIENINNTSFPWAIGPSVVSPRS